MKTPRLYCFTVEYIDIDMSIIIEARGESAFRRLLFFFHY